MDVHVHPMASKFKLQHDDHVKPFLCHQISIFLHLLKSSIHRGNNIEISKATIEVYDNDPLTHQLVQHIDTFGGHVILFFIINIFKEFF